VTNDKNTHSDTRNATKTAAGTVRAQGSVALSLCAAAHPLYTGFTKSIGTSVSEATMRSNPIRALPGRLTG
jgi:ribosomal protein L31